MKFILKALLAAVIIMVIALVAAPYFVRQEQVKNFVEKRVVLPDGRKLKLIGEITFGIFPKTYVQVPEANIVYKDGSKKVFNNFYFGFNPADLLGKGVGFETAFFFGDNQYQGDIYIAEYENFYKAGRSPIRFSIDKPLNIKVKADFSHSNNKYSLSNFEITHKQTKATGNLTIDGTGEAQKIILDTVIESADIENIRRLIEFGKVENNNFNLLSGKGIVNLDITAQGNNAEQLKSSLNGKGDVEVSDAAIYGLDLNEIIGAPQEVRLTDDEDKKIDITEAEGKFTITNGLINISEMSASNPIANITGQGVVDIIAGAVKVAFDVNADIASARVMIPLLASGPFDDIKFSPRIGDAVINNLGTIVEQTNKINLKNIKIELDGGVDKAIDQLRDIGKGMGIDLDKLTKGKTKELGTPQEPAAPAEPATTATPAAPAQPQQPAAPAEPAQPSSMAVPASMKNNSQPAQ